MQGQGRREQAAAIALSPSPSLSPTPHTHPCTSTTLPPLHPSLPRYQSYDVVVALQAPDFILKGSGDLNRLISYERGWGGRRGEHLLACFLSIWSMKTPNNLRIVNSLEGLFARLAYLDKVCFK